MTVSNSTLAKISLKTKRGPLVKEAIQAEERYMREKKLDWEFTKEVLAQINESLLPEGSRIYVGSSNITIRIPWGLEFLAAGRRAMGQGWKFSANYTDNSGTLTKTYYRTNSDTMNPVYRSTWLNLIMDSEKLDPDTCRRIEVGEKTYTQKIYQVICEDGVKEVLGKAEALDQDVE